MNGRRLEISAEATVRGCCRLCRRRQRERRRRRKARRGWLVGGAGRSRGILLQHKIAHGESPHGTGDHDPGPLQVLPATESSGKAQY